MSCSTTPFRARLHSEAVAACPRRSRLSSRSSSSSIAASFVFSSAARQSSSLAKRGLGLGGMATVHRALEHLLGGLATVPPDRGIFLAITWRMHPDICRLISDAVYDGRLQSDRSTIQQRINVAAGEDAALAPTGIRFVPIDHAGHAQKSPPEAERLKQSFTALLGKEWINQRGERKVIGLNDILVVSPYNMQVNHLRDILPRDARVGPVDKFQGQEAAVVLISMTTSSGEDMPRNIEFLYSRNRLNVAISRARCLSVVFASPRLLEIPCNTIEQMQLVNTLCWAKNYSEQLVRGV